MVSCLHGGGAEGIGRTYHHFLALFGQHGGELADGAVLPTPFTPTTRTIGRKIKGLHGIVVSP